MYKLSDDYKEIVIEETSEDGDWDVFREKLVNAQSKTKTVRCGIFRNLGEMIAMLMIPFNRARLERDPDTLSMTSTTSWLLVRDQEVRSHSLHGLQMMPVSR